MRREVAIDPRTPTTLYVTHGGGVAKSTDGGETWIAVTGDVDGYRLAIDPETPTTVYVGTSPSALVLKTTDGGATWTSVSIEPSNSWVQALVIDPQTPTTLYAGLGRDGVFKSTNAGGTWSALNAGLTNLSIGSLAIDPRRTTTLYAGTGSGVFKLEQSDAGSSSPSGMTSPTAHWRLDEGSGTVASDSSGNGHDGTLINDPTWTAGHSGSALAFDGLDDYVEVAHATSLNAYPFTVTAWRIGTPGPPTTSQPVHLARYPGAYGGAEYFPGVLDEVWIYDRALNPDEIASLASPATLSSTAP